VTAWLSRIDAGNFYLSAVTEPEEEILVQIPANAVQDPVPTSGQMGCRAHQ
jgi:hypothetical protein